MVGAACYAQASLGGAYIMEIVLTEGATKPETEQHLPWHKPEIQCLTISIDTAFGVTSGPDAIGTGFALED